MKRKVGTLHEGEKAKEGVKGAHIRFFSCLNWISRIFCAGEREGQGVSRADTPHTLYCLGKSPPCFPRLHSCSPLESERTIR